MKPASTSSTASIAPETKSSRYGWVIVCLASLLMLATLPGRTQGLGLITEPLLKDLRVERVTFASINLWATLLGAAFCLPIGWAIDRFGLHLVTFIMTLATGLSAWLLSRQDGSFGSLLLAVTLMRGFGQSALSVCSITAVGKWFSARPGPAMGVFASLMLFLMAMAFIIVGNTVTDAGWRVAWSNIGLALIFIVAPLMLMLLKNPPPLASAEMATDESLTADAEVAVAEVDERLAASPLEFSLAEALRTPTFWIFAGATALFGLASSGLGLFQQAVLAERGFDEKTYHTLMAVTTLLTLLAQLMTGWLSLRCSIGTLTGTAMLFYALALGMLPFVNGATQLWGFAALIGIAAGMIIVVFFAAWGQLFGRVQLGRIQAAAQMLTVFASAIGPLLFAECQARFHSYTPILLFLAPLVLLFGVAAWFVKTPTPQLPPKLLLKSA